MNLIPSFTIDHTKLKPGIYILRVDDVNGIEVTTYDIRMKCPNIEPCVDLLGMHTIEHLVATYLRNDEEYKEKLIYWGPMGCLTGCYMILKGRPSPEEVCKIIIRAFEFVAGYEGKIPGTAPEECGNYLLHNLTLAKYEAKKYVEILKTNPCFEYPKA